jgi:hypothetical protein
MREAGTWRNLVRQVNHTSSIGGSIMKQLQRALAVCAVFSFPQLAAARTARNSPGLFTPSEIALVK